MDDEELRNFRAQANAGKMCKQMDEFVDNAEAPAEVVDILVGWAQVLGAVIATIPGANAEDYDKIMKKCVENADAAFIAEWNFRNQRK